MEEKCELIKLDDLSGIKASIYTVFVDNDEESLFEKFLIENTGSFRTEIQDIVNRLNIIGKETGAREYFFKKYEGVPGDGVCALYDNPKKHLRLYCIRYGSGLVVLGGGGYKAKEIKAFQENKKLTKGNYFLRWLSEKITEKMKEKEIKLTSNGGILRGT